MVPALLHLAGPRPLLAWAVSCAVVCLTPTAARAESAALLTVGGEARLTAADKGRALAALTAALEAEEVQVMTRAEADRRLGRRSPLRDCARADCGLELRRALAVDLVAGVALLPDAGGERPTSAIVTILDASGAAFDATAPITANDLPAAIAAAYTQARERQRRGPGPWLRIEGTPAGAVVAIDGTDEGVLPFQERVAAGEHVVRVTLTGHRAHEERVRVAPGAGTEVRLNVRLEPAATQARVTPPRRRTAPAPPRRSHEPRGGRAIVGPLVLGVAGLAGMGIAGVRLAMGETCERRGASGTCLELDEPNIPFIALYGGLGAATVVIAIVWFAVSDGDAEPPPVTATSHGLVFRTTF
jgi:hypothetical protein